MVKDKAQAIPSGDRAGSAKQPFLNHIFALCLGTMFGLGFLKFGNPVILDNQIAAPQGGFEFLLNPWPVIYGYFLLPPLLFLAWKSANKKFPAPRSRGLLWVLLGWLVWQWTSAFFSVEPRLSRPTVIHFTVCTLFCLTGFFRFEQIRTSLLFWGMFMGSFLLVLHQGFEQHFGGLEQTRKYFHLYILPTLSNPPPELLKKMETNRIFSTLFYPNTLAGLILMTLPFLIYVTVFLLQRVKPVLKWMMFVPFCAAALACLYWTGSKSGWLILICLVCLAILRIPLKKAIKLGFVIFIIVIGTLGFAIKYQSFFKKGATSVVARSDYWSGAWQNTLENPIFGSGPGTFGKVYSKLKKPEAEMARLTHNDYIEQATDSGFLGFFTYSAFIIGVLIWLYRYSHDWRSFEFWLWLSMAGIAIQGFSEVNLYIPGIAWPYFFFLGCGLSSALKIRESTRKVKQNRISGLSA